MNPTGFPLAGRAVLVTRPVDQAGGLASRIAGLGGSPILFPALAIAPPSDAGQLERGIAGLTDYHWLIFVSPTAVEWFWPRLLERYGGWPAGPALAAVGQGSARALHRLGARQVIAPEAGADSESLLAMPAMSRMAGQRVLIVRGEGGRDVLAEGLRQRGARVDYAECYRRVRPGTDAGELLTRWRQGGIDAVTVSSREILANLHDMLGDAGQELLRATPMFVLHARIAESARALGIVTVIATPPGEDGLIAALLEWFDVHHDQH